MAVSTEKNTQYNIQPEVMTQMSNRIERAIKYGTHAMQALPIEQALTPIDQNYEYLTSDHDVGVGFEMDVVSPPSASFHTEYKDIKTPVAFANVTLSYDEMRRAMRDPYTLQRRLDDVVAILQRRINLIIYMGDTKHSINDLGSATPWEAPDTTFAVDTIANISATMAAAWNQLKTDLKYDPFYIDAPFIVMGTPDVTVALLDALDTNQVTNGLSFLNQMLVEMTGNALSRYIENPYLGGSYSVNNAGVATITPGTDHMATYFQHPDLIRLLFSGMEIRVSPLDRTKGQTFQPIMRATRLDLKSGAASGAGLIETDVTGV